MIIYNYYFDWPEYFFKGDSLDLSVVVRDKDISAWKIRAEIFDDAGNCLRFATSNVTNGSNDQIQITDGADGEFTIKVGNNKTTCFQNKAKIEVEFEEDEKIKTLFVEDINFLDEKIDWTDV